LRKTLDERCRLDPSFWDSASLADLELLLAMAASGPDAPHRKRRQETSPLAVQMAYQQAILRGASARERASVSEHLDFLRALQADDDPLNATLDRIKEYLA
jgi:uncharacterized membrane protein YccC